MASLQLQVLLMLAGAIALLLSVPVNGSRLLVNGVSKPCSPGSFSSSGRSPCQPCPEGSYTSHWSSTSCELAQPGYYVPLPGSSSPFACQDGTYSRKGSSDCTLTVKDLLGQENHANTRMKTRPAAVKRPCQSGLQHCPIYGKWSGGMFIKNYECMDVQHDLESCGGCVHNDSLDGDANRAGGRDCSLIPGVDTVRCVQGKCVIDKCSWGYSISVDKSSCNSIYGKDF